LVTLLQYANGSEFRRQSFQYQMLKHVDSRKQFWQTFCWDVLPNLKTDRRFTAKL